ncbi:COX15/CtaA family protein, partial [Nostocoides japonicum]|uniref:COX15/CtaA family protein n=1 Tax=Nostocoides japonicum TaxID=99481 RepID=UPI002E14B576
ADPTGPPAGPPVEGVSPWLRRALVTNLVLEILIVVTGGTVRVTASGLGCPTWPKCTPESLVPVRNQAQGFHSIIEYGNRMLTPVVSLAALGVLVAIWMLAPNRPGLRRIAWLPLAGVLLQAVVGGVTVRMDLNPAVVSLHFLASMVLVALSAYLLARSGEGDGPRQWLVRREVRWVATVVCGLAAVILVLGTIVTGTGPHGGSIDVHRYPFDPRSVSWLHADAVMLFTGLVVAMILAVRLSTEDQRARRAWLALLGVTLAQGLIGYTQYFTKLPEALVVAHMLGASILVVALTIAVVALRRRPPVPPA